MHLSYLGPLFCDLIFHILSSLLIVGSGGNLIAAWWQVLFSLVPSSGLRNSHLEGRNHWWLCRPCLLIWQETFHFSTISNWKHACWFSTLKKKKKKILIRICLGLGIVFAFGRDNTDTQLNKPNMTYTEMLRESFIYKKKA